jgi:predicted ATPase/class 3 adenylate cyclase
MMTGQEIAPFLLVETMSGVAATLSPYNDGMQKLPTGTVTYLMTDIVGSSRLWEINPEGMADALFAYEQIIGEAVATCGGALIKSRGEGDSHFAVFDRADSAVACALNFVLSLQRQEWPDNLTIRARCALHTGASEFRNADYYGPAVNRCARLRAIANPGQVLLSAATQKLAQGSLPADSSLRELGTHRLKDLLTPETVSELVHPELQSSSDVLSSLNRLAHNLPVQLTSFVGRQEEVSQVAELLKEHRLVTLTGSGGAGKTRLALQVAAEVADRFEGVWFIDLTKLVPGEELAQLIAKVLHVDHHAKSSIDTVCDALVGRRTLVLLDNCEHVIDSAADAAAELLQSCPDLVILATSREALRVPGEFRLRVPSLELPGKGATLEEMQQCDAVRLFVERARLRSSNFELTPRNCNAIVGLCRLLDGIPLAIEQAASQAALLSPQQMLNRFREHLKDLRTDDRGVVPRHRTIRATIVWSYKTLSAPEQSLLQYCAVFRGGWTLDAIEAVAEDLGFEGDVAAATAELLNKSLIFQEESSGEQQRFRMLQTVREFALEELGENRPVAQQAHAEHFRKTVAQAKPGELLTLASDHHEDLIVATEHYLSKGTDRALELVSGIRSHLLRSGHVKKGRDLLASAINIYKGDSAAKALALNTLGAFQWRLGALAEARRAYNESLSIWEALGNHSQQAAVLHNMGLLAAAEKQYGEATELLQRSHSIYRGLPEHQGMAVTMMSLGRLHLITGQPEEAVEDLTKASFLMSAVKDYPRLAICQCNLALALHTLSDNSAALLELERSFTRWRETEDKGALAEGLAVWACVLDALGAREEAVGAARTCHALEQENGYGVESLEATYLQARGLDPSNLREESAPVGIDYDHVVQSALALIGRHKMPSLARPEVLDKGIAKL